MKKLPELSERFRQTTNLIEVIYSIVYGAILGAVFPGYLNLAHEHGVPATLAIALVAPLIVITLLGLSYNARLRAGVFEFKRPAFTIVGPIFAAALLCFKLSVIGAWDLLTLLLLWAVPYLVAIVFGPAFRKGGWNVRVVAKGPRKK